jgi:hypothetical protein
MLAPPDIGIARPSCDAPAPPIANPVLWSGAMPPTIAHFYSAFDPLDSQFPSVSREGLALENPRSVIDHDKSV